MPADLTAFYDLNPVGVIDQNTWDLKMAEVNLQFRSQAIYTPLIDWDASSQATGAISTTEYELLEGEVDSNPIPMTANYIGEAQGIDSRSRAWTVLRYGDKVQYHKSSSYFNQWKISGSRDWQPLLRSMLGWNVVEKHEILARNVWFKGSKTYWTYAGSATNWDTLTTSDKFSIDVVKKWNLWLGSTGSPVVPGDEANAKLAMIPPGAKYDFTTSMITASNNEAALWRDSMTYGGQKMNGEIGSYMGVKFVETPNNRFGLNKNVLYNCGRVSYQFGVTLPIHMGDGAPDPETTKVDEVWYVGQKDVTHYLQLEDSYDSTSEINVNDVVTIHTATTTTYGVTGGVDPFDGRTIVRRVVAVDTANHRISFDRPVMFNYTAGFVGSSVTGATTGTFYAYVTKAVNIGFGLVLGSRGGVKGKVHKPIEFYDPDPIDDFKSVWRFVWDDIVGYNIADPNYFSLYFFNVSIPKPGGVI